jgi:hypothetical protein
MHSICADAWSNRLTTSRPTGPESTPEALRPQRPTDPGILSGIASASGYVLALSYPVLALSTGVRAIYQLFFKEGGLIGSGNPDLIVGPSLSALAATLYLLATIGFAYRRRWSWRLSVFTLGLETLLTLVVGTLSLPFLFPELIGGTVWRLYGIDYGFFPLFQPLLGLIWLFWPATLKAYGIDVNLPWRRDSEATDSETTDSGRLDSAQDETRSDSQGAME